MGRHPKFLGDDIGVCLVCQEVYEKVRVKQIICEKQNCKKAYNRIKKHIIRNNENFK